jgi:hypothetical protein
VSAVRHDWAALDLQLRQMIFEGRSRRQIAAALGLCRATLNKRIADLGLRTLGHSGNRYGARPAAKVRAEAVVVLHMPRRAEKADSAPQLPERRWCDQCDRSVGAVEADRCGQRLCGLRRAA